MRTRIASASLAASVLAAIILAGCTMRAGASTAPRARGTAAGDEGAAGTATTSGSSGTLAGIGDSGLSAAPAPVPTDQCTDASRLVYVVSRANDLYSLRPDSVTFTRVGTLACPAQPGAFPFSMAVDRGGTAWILYSDGLLYRASTADASCTKTAFAPDQANFKLFGMGFAATAPGASTDVLYVSENVVGRGLGTIDLATLTLAPVGAYGGALTGQRAELTGTGDGKLYGFFTTDPAQVAEIGKASAAIDQASPLAAVNAGTDWAFSFWGGDFYLYTGNSTDTRQNGSAVTRFRPSDGSVTVVSPGVGFFITGAGVSTCAPVVPPPPPPPPPPPK